MSDFGLTEDMYSSNYYRHDSSETRTQEKVPIKWMAPESIETGRFDERTDVVSTLVSPNNHGIVAFKFVTQWSFGVTCWEVFTVEESRMLGSQSPLYWESSALDTDCIGPAT